MPELPTQVQITQIIVALNTFFKTLEPLVNRYLQSPDFIKHLQEFGEKEAKLNSK